MLLVKTHIGPSSINGIGLFADQFIPKGYVTWKLTPGLDLIYTPLQLEQLPDIAKFTFLKHCYLSTRTGLYILCFDNARFLNHSDHPNIGEGAPDEGSQEGVDFATCDIKPGEELTCDYRIFDARYQTGFR